MQLREVRAQLTIKRSPTYFETCLKTLYRNNAVLCAIKLKKRWIFYDKSTKNSASSVRKKVFGKLRRSLQGKHWRRKNDLLNH